MKNNLSILMSVVGLAASIVPGAQAQEDVTNRFSVSGRIGFGISARFKGLAVLPVPTLNRATPGGNAYNYDNGYVLTDTSGNFGGQTWYWGYDNSASQVSGNNILLSRNTSAALKSSTETDAGPGYGAEIVYTRMLGRAGRLNYGFEAAINYLSLSLSDSRSRPVTLTRLTDAYPFTPGTTPPDATPSNPYQGSFDGPGFLIGDTAASSSTTTSGGALSAGQRNFDADIWGIRLGPYLEFPVGEKLKLSLSGGFAAALIDAEASWRETIVISGIAGPSVSGSGHDSDLLLGAYVAGNVAWELNERWSIVGSVQYQYLGSYQHSFGGRTVEANLTHGFFITLGVGYKF
jgi:hypothetical protein